MKAYKPRPIISEDYAIFLSSEADKLLAWRKAKQAQGFSVTAKTQSGYVRLFARKFAPRPVPAIARIQSALTAFSDALSAYAAANATYSPTPEGQTAFAHSYCTMWEAWTTLKLSVAQSRRSNALLGSSWAARFLATPPQS